MAGSDPPGRVKPPGHPHLQQLDSLGSWWLEVAHRLDSIDPGRLESARKSVLEVLRGSRKPRKASMAGKSDGGNKSAWVKSLKDAGHPPLTEFMLAAGLIACLREGSATLHDGGYWRAQAVNPRVEHDQHRQAPTARSKGRKQRRA